MKEELTKEQIRVMKSEADKIQPDVVMERDCEGLSQKDRENYQYFNKIYKELCEKDLSFSICFLAPESLKPFTFYRTVDPENQDKYQRVCGNLLGKMYKFLYWCGYIHFLEEIGEIKILKNINCKTSKEQINEIVNEK